MRALVAVAWREIAQRRMLLVAAVFAGLVSLAVPVARGLTGADAADARAGTGLILAIAFAGGTAIALGASMLAPRIADRRVAFDLARPVSAFAVWAGRLAAATVLAGASAGLVWLLSGLGGGSTLAPALPVSPAATALLGLVAIIVLYAAFHAIAVAVAARSAWIVLDAACALAVAFIFAASLELLPRFAASVPFRNASIAFTVLCAVSLLFAGYVSVARGRTDIRSAHRALSVALWIPVGAAALGVYGYAHWVMAAGPGDLAGVTNAQPASAGDWITVEGPARSAHATFLFDTATGRSARVLVRDWARPVFSRDGRRAAWVEVGGESPVWTMDLTNAAAVPVRSRLNLSGSPSMTVLSDDGSRLATVEKGVLSIHDLAASRTLSSARVADKSAFARGFFVSRDVFRLYRTAETPSGAQLDILEFDVVSRRLTQTGSFTSGSGWCVFTADLQGDRLVVVKTQSKEVWLLDGRSGRVLTQLAPALPGMSRWTGFLADGRVVMSDSSSEGRMLRLFSPDGAASNVVPLPGVEGLALGGEAAPGRLVVAIGNGPAWRVELVDVDRGERRRLADGLFPTSRLSTFQNSPNVAPAVGSTATKLYYRLEESLVRLDPATGKQTVILGKGAH